MNEQEMRELDAWIGKLFDLHVFDPLPTNKGVCAVCNHYYAFAGHEPFKPTTDPAAAMQVLEKCSQGGANIISIKKDQEGWWLDNLRMSALVGGIEGDKADTLSLAICLFAKKLYETQK